MDNYSLLSIPFFFFSFIFFVGIYVSWYLPGRLLLGEREANTLTRYLLSLVMGMVLWGIQAYLFGYLHLRLLTYVYTVSPLMYYWGRHRRIAKEILTCGKERASSNKLLTGMILFGICLQLLPVFNSGFLYKDGVHFSGVNAYDGVMHLAFIRSMVHHFPPIEPGAFGHALTNYHYWSDLIIAELVRIWHLPIAHTFFQFMPLTVSLLTGIAAFKVVRIFGFSKTSGIWAVFFTYFAGDASYLLVLVVHKTLSFSAPAIDNGVTQFLNMPHAMAKLVFLTSLIPLQYWLKTKQTYWGVLTVLCMSVLVGIKIYFGLFAIMGFLLIVMVRVLIDIRRNLRKISFITNIKRVVHNQKNTGILTIFLLVFSALIYFPPNKSSGGLFFAPLEWAKIFIGPDVLNWGNWWPRHRVYEIQHNFKGIAFLDTMAILITLISVHGTRLIGLLPRRSVWKKLGYEKILFFFPGLIFFQFLGMYTLQESGGLNVFNFFVVGTVILSLLSAMLLEHVSFTTKKIMPSLLAGIIILVTIPRIFYEIGIYVPKYIGHADDTTIVSRGELEGLSYLQHHTPQNAIVQSHVLNHYDIKTPYVSYFSDRLTFLTGVGVQETHNQPIQERQEILAKLFKSDHPQVFTTDGKRAGIDYIYLRKVIDEKITFPLDTHLLVPVFENNTVVIYKLQL